MRSSTNEQKSDNDGRLTKDFKDLIIKLSESRIRLIVTGFKYVHPKRKVPEKEVDIYSNDGFY